MKSKVLLISVSVLLVIVLIIGISYAVWLITETQVNSNVLATDCFDIEFSEDVSSNINLQKAFPITDEESLELSPYTFSVKNACELPVSYQINLEVFNSTTLDHSLIAGVVDNNVISVATDKDVVTSILENTISYNYKTEILKYNEVNNHEFRMWIDESATLDNSQNKLIEARITIVAVPVSYDYDVLADLLSDDSLVEGDIVSTGGYYLLDDEGGSIYEIKSTGTANSMNIIELDNGLYAHLKLDEYMDEINVMQYGLKVNDASYDSGIAIQAAIESGAKNIYMPKEKEVYLNTQVVIKDHSYEKMIFNGNDTKVFLQNEYYALDWNTEHIFRIEADNFVFENFKFKSLNTAVRSGGAGKTNIGVYRAKNVLIQNVDIEGPEAIYNEDGTTHPTAFIGIDLFSGWDNIVVDNVKIVIENDTIGGACFMIRDIWDEGLGSATLKNSYLQKIYHDEIISIGMPNAQEFNDITIVNNTFISKTGVNSYSPHVISLGDGASTAPMNNFYFADNIINVDSTYTGLNIRTHGNNNIIENNEITINVSNGYETTDYNKVGYAIYYNPVGLESGEKPIPLLVKNNEITINNDGDNLLNNVEFSEAIWGYVNAENNTINVNGDLNNVVVNGYNIEGNTFNITGNVVSVQRNTYSFDSNIVNVNEAYSISRFDYYTMNGNYSFSDNDININNDFIDANKTDFNMITNTSIAPNTTYTCIGNEVTVTNSNDSKTNAILNIYNPTINDGTGIYFEIKNNTLPLNYTSKSTSLDQYITY